MISIRILDSEIGEELKAAQLKGKDFEFTQKYSQSALKVREQKCFFLGRADESLNSDLRKFFFG